MVVSGNSHDHLTKSIEYCIWANAAWIDLIGDRISGDEFVFARMNHILLGEEAWFSRIAGKEPNREIWRIMNVLQLHEQLENNRETYRRIFSENLDRIIV